MKVSPNNSETDNPMVDAFIGYHEHLYFIVPDIYRRYYRLYGDLEYDRVSLRAEISVMELRIREVLRRARSHASISATEEREISTTSHELGSHLYKRLQSLHARIVRSRAFRFDHKRERHGRFLLHDIATAVLGLADDELRARQAGTLAAACAAYGGVDITRLLDIHERVQDLLAAERRDHIETTSEEEHQDLRAEQADWERRTEELYENYPLTFRNILDTPEGIAQHELRLRNSITRLQWRLERTAVIYDGVVAATRFRN